MSASTLCIARTIPTPEDLREYLDELNDIGAGNSAVGIDSHDVPFIIWLTGIYAETEVVMNTWPWDTEAEMSGASDCDECGVSRKDLGMNSLNFPVTVLEKKRST